MLDYCVYTNKAMREYQHKYMLRTLLYSKVTIVILFLLVVILLRSIMELNAKRKEAVLLRDETKTERQNLEEKVAHAKEKNDFIKTDRGFEEYVRATYPVVKDGEGVIVVYDGDKTPVSKVRDDMTFMEKVTVVWRRIFGDRK